MSIIERIKSYRPWYHVNEILYGLGGVVWFIVGSYIVCLANAYEDSNNPSLRIPVDQRTRLPDPILDSLFPGYEKSGLPVNLSDLLVRASAALIIARIVLNGRGTLLMLRRITYTMGTTYLLRAPFVVMTVLPNPLLTCVSDMNPNYAYYALELLIQAKFSCGDVMFSGHTIMFMTSVLAYVDFPLFNHYYYVLVQNFIFICYGFFCLFSLVISAYHYTVDVVVGLMITLFIWKSYMYLATHDTFDDRWFGKIIKFIDRDPTLESTSKRSTEATVMEMV